MTRLMDIKKAKTLSLTVSGLFLVIHVILFFFFRNYHVYPMMYFNMFSMVFYIAMFGIVLKGWLTAFAVGVYLEVVLHMSASVFFTGWASGFQVTLIGMGFLLFYSEYVGRYLHLKVIKAAPMSIIGGIAYVAMLIVNHKIPEQYPLPSEVSFYLNIFWGIVVFAVSIFFLTTFVRLTVRSDQMLIDALGHDQLTGLPNRYFLLNRLDEINQEKGLAGYWVAMIDIDDFKIVNDSYGHNCGDYILRSISEILASNADKDHIVCRWGGEEFLIVGESGNDFSRCVKELENLRKDAMGRVFHYDDNELRLTLTIGVAPYVDRCSIDQWIDQADQKMYTGKQSGKNQVVV